MQSEMEWPSGGELSLLTRVTRLADVRGIEQLRKWWHILPVFLQHRVLVALPPTGSSLESALRNPKVLSMFQDRGVVSLLVVQDRDDAVIRQVCELTVRVT
jgi:hypothetical protein